MTPVFDTNILIDFANGISQAREVLAHYSQRAISAVTWTEMLAGEKDDAGRHSARLFLQKFEVIPFDVPIAELAAILRHEYRLKFPDAAILATAKQRQTRLITRDSKDFPVSDPAVHIPYQL